VDRLGIEPSTEGLQSDPVHQHPAHGASGETRTPSARLQDACTTRRAALAVPSARLERALYGLSDRCLLPLGYEGDKLPGKDSNLDSSVQSAVSCR
jgi:hypothetical protein